MKAKFQIQNVQEAEPSLPMHFVFSQRGGLIGASSESTWQVQHVREKIQDAAARVVVQNNNFTIEALSGAKIRINGASEPIPAGRPVILADKDEFVLGGLNIGIAIEGEDKAQYDTRNVQTMVGVGSAGSDALVIDGVLTEARVLEPHERLAEVSDQSDPLDALAKSVRKKDTIDPMQAFAEQESRTESEGETLLRGEVSKLNKKTEAPAQQDAADMHFSAMPSTGIHRDKYGFEQAQAEDANASFAHSDAVTLDLPHSVDHVALRPLSRRLGIHLGDMSTEHAHRVMADIGGSLRAALAGLNKIYRSNDNRRGNFPLATMHMHALEDNPIRFSPDIESTLHAFFSKRGPVHLSAPAAVEETLEHLLCHQIATEYAIDKALDAVMTALLPNALERRFRAYDPDQEPDDKQDREAWSWRMYRAYFSELRSQRQQGLQMLFWEVFSQEYQVSMRQQQMERDLAGYEEGDLD